MAPPETADSERDSTSARKGSNKGTTVNVEEDPPPVSDPEKGASGNHMEEDTEKLQYNFFDLLSHAKGEFIFWWFWGTIILGILLALSATRFRAVNIHNVRLFGFFCWLAISWAGLLVSYLFAWTLSYSWLKLCNIIDGVDDYESLFADIRHSVMLLAWGFICWSTVPLLCRVDHHHCTTSWVHTFQKVMLAALVIDIIYFVKDFLLELLFLRAAIEFLHPRLRTLENITFALGLIIRGFPEEPETPSARVMLHQIMEFFILGWLRDIQQFVRKTRRWSKFEEQRKIEFEEDYPGQGDVEEIPVEDPRWAVLVGDAVKKLGTPDGSKKDYRAVAQFLTVKSVFTKCNLDNPLNSRTPMRVQTQGSWSKVLHSFKNFFKKHPLDDFCKPLPECIHAKARLCKCKVDSHSDASAQDKPCQCGDVAHPKTSATSELQENTSFPKAPAVDTSSNDSCQCQGSCQTIARGGWCKRQVALHILQLLSGSEKHFASLVIPRFDSLDKLWGVLDRNGDGFASFEELHWLVEDVDESFKEAMSGQKNLMKVIRELNLVLSVVLLAPVAVTYVLFFVKNPSTYLAPMWATFAGLSFALQGPVKSFTDACVFVFSQHPYDVGDWVIWGKEKDLKLIVEEVHLLKTTFTCADSGKTVHIPHTEICTGYIENLSRTSTYFVKSIVLHLEGKVVKCHKEVIDNFKEEKLRNLWRSDDKRDIFRYHQLPDISVVPIKSEDLEETGIRVDFKRKEWTPGRFFRHEQKCRHEVMSFIRQHLPDLIKSDSKINSGKLEISGTIKLEKAASSNGGSQPEELFDSV